MMLQHPKHFIADGAVVRLVNPGRQWHRLYVKLRIGLVRGSSVQRGTGLAGVGWFGYAAKLCHIWAEGKRINHAHQTPGRMLGNLSILLPNEIVRSAVGDQDNSSRGQVIHGRSGPSACFGTAIMRNLKLLPGWKFG
jgi:hypothetical protein